MPLGPLTFLVGANAAGKTNVISALRFLRTGALHNVKIAVDDFGGISEVRNKILRERGESKPMTVRLKFSPLAGRFKTGHRHVEIPKATYELKLNVRNDSGLPEIVSEHLTAELRPADSPPIEHKLSRTAEEVVIEDPLATESAWRDRPNLHFWAKVLPKHLTAAKQDENRLIFGDHLYYSAPCLVDSMAV